MRATTTNDKAKVGPKVRHGKCAVCQTKTEQSKLFDVPNVIGLAAVKMCEPCGKKKIIEWNSIVLREVGHGTL